MREGTVSARTHTQTPTQQHNVLHTRTCIRKRTTLHNTPPHTNLVAQFFVHLILPRFLSRQVSLVQDLRYAQHVSASLFEIGPLQVSEKRLQVLFRFKRGGLLENCVQRNETKGGK